jgi:hypothetical protein
MLAERWVPVRGLENLYEISSLGRIKALTREVTTKCGRTWIKPEKFLSPSLTERGYCVGVYNGS